MESKKWYQSKSVMGSVVTLIAMVLGIFGFGMGAEDQATLVNIVVGAGGFVGSILAIYGRVKASKKIK